MSKSLPPTAQDKQMSLRHLRDHLDMNRKHAEDHKRGASRTSDPDSKKYHQSHAEGHLKDLEKAKKHYQKVLSKKVKS